MPILGATETDANAHACDLVRAALWHLHLSFIPSDDQFGFTAFDALPTLPKDAEPKKITLVPYSPFITSEPPVSGSYISALCCLKDEAYQKLYIVDPTDGVHKVV